MIRHLLNILPMHRSARGGPDRYNAGIVLVFPTAPRPLVPEHDVLGISQDLDQGTRVPACVLAGEQGIHVERHLLGRLLELHVKRHTANVLAVRDDEDPIVPDFGEEQAL